MLNRTVWKRGPLVAEVRSESEDTIALLHLDKDEPRVLNGTAASIWRLVDGVRSQDEIVAVLREEFDDPGGLLTDHVEAFFGRLRVEMLVEPASGDRVSPEPKLTGGSE